MGALDGVLVLSLGQAVAAPYCSSRLADAGARVIEIERPEGAPVLGPVPAIGEHSIMIRNEFSEDRA